MLTKIASELIQIATELNNPNVTFQARVSLRSTVNMKNLQRSFKDLDRKGISNVIFTDTPHMSKSGQGMEFVMTGLYQVNPRFGDSVEYVRNEIEKHVSFVTMTNVVRIQVTLL